MSSGAKPVGDIQPYREVRKQKPVCKISKYTADRGPLISEVKKQLEIVEWKNQFLDDDNSQEKYAEFAIKVMGSSARYHSCVKCISFATHKQFSVSSLGGHEIGMIIGNFQNFKDNKSAKYQADYLFKKLFPQHEKMLVDTGRAKIVDGGDAAEPKTIFKLILFSDVCMAATKQIDETICLNISEGENMLSNLSKAPDDVLNLQNTKIECVDKNIDDKSSHNSQDIDQDKRKRMKVSVET